MTKQNLLGFLIACIYVTSSFAATEDCDSAPVICKDQIIEALKENISALEIENAELRYDVDDWREKAKKYRHKLNGCEINLKNVKTEILSCGKL